MYFDNTSYTLISKYRVFAKIAVAHSKYSPLVHYTIWLKIVRICINLQMRLVVDMNYTYYYAILPTICADAHNQLIYSGT